MEENESMKNIKINFLKKDIYIKYSASKNIRVSCSKNLKSWKVLKKDLLQPRKNYFDSFSLHVLNAILINKGILLLYFVKRPLSIGIALFDKKKPTKLLWRSANPIWKTQKKLQPLEVKNKKK